MITDFQIFEGKQVGVIYHFTTIDVLFDLLHKARYSTRDANKIYLKFGYRTNISFTRDYNMKSPELKKEKRCVRISIDGDKLSYNNKIEPFSDPIYNKNRVEREERVLRGRWNDTIDITKCIIQIDVLNEPVLGKNESNPINSYTFPNPQETQVKLTYISKPDEITRLYALYLKECVKFFNLCQFNFKLNVVDKMSPIKLNENITDIGISPPKQRQKFSGGGEYLYYAIFEEMFIPSKLEKLLSPKIQYVGDYLLKNLYNKGNSHQVGIYEFKILPKYVDTKIIDGKKYNKIILNDYLKTPTRLTEEKIEELHNSLIFNILDNYNTENLDLTKLLKFNLFSSYINI